MSSDPGKKPTHVVGIGASAGGLEAIEALFDGLSSDLGMAYVVVQHLSPDFKSLMSELLARYTSMPIYQAEHECELQANCIYLLPPKKEIAISNWRLLLREKDRSESLTFPIDHFLKSLAQDVGDRAVGIILSGTGTDGSRGIKDIHEAGGLVIVQSEKTARFDGMPKSAMDSGIADLSLAPDEIKGALAQYQEFPSSTLCTPAEASSIGGSGLPRLFELVRENFGLDLNDYKTNTVIRRTEKRMLLCKQSHIDDYVRLLESEPSELERLYADLLIGVTQFFRDPMAFESLKAHVRELGTSVKEKTEVRAWVAGCSTGQEAYTVAMVIAEALEGTGLSIKLFATDIDESALAVAQAGEYGEEEILDIPAEYSTKYFNHVGGHYQVIPALRQMIVFAPHNFLRDAPFTKLDLVCCRNVLIYMLPRAQKKALSLFHFGMASRGLLFLGPSETASEVAEEFDSVDGRWRIFRKRRDIRLLGNFQVEDIDDSDLRATGLPKLRSAQLRPRHEALIRMYDALLNNVIPAAYLVNVEGVLLHTFGDAGKYLKFESGRPTGVLSDRVSPNFRLALVAGLRKALRDDEELSFCGLQVEGANGEEFVDLNIRPIEIEQGDRVCLVSVTSADDVKKSLDMGTPSVAETGEQVVALESELAIVKQSLESTIQELETSNEELMATNEEMLASNEELQSTNEELHSVNEELYTVNAEHQKKISELSEVTRDMDNLLYSTEVHTIFLDEDLQIRKFTPRVSEVFNLIDQDVGRRIDSFSNSIACEGLKAKLQHVVATSQPHEEEVCDTTGEWFLMRLLPYRSANRIKDVTSSRADGALLTLVNISKLKHASEALADSVRKRDEFLAMLSHELRNPLSTIVSATKVIRKQELPAETGESLAIIQRQSTHMTTLLNDLLDVTRVSQGKIHLKKRPFEVQKAVEKAIESVRARCESRDQVIETVALEDPIWVNGSEPRILQIVSNLLTNASKYSGRGDVINVKVQSHGDLVSIHVRDEGVGIPREQLSSIFELFVQSDRTLDRADGGLGIGLTLVKSLVDLHRGKVEAKSDGAGCGSEFIVHLPMCEAVDTAMPSEQDSEYTTSGRIVLIEDNIDATKMLAFLLEDAGFEISIANDGRSGLELIERLSPDTAIVDIGLPEMDGYEVARAIRGDLNRDQMQLIALTGYGQTSDREQALAAGFDEHVVKPVDPDVLCHLLATKRITGMED